MRGPPVVKRFRINSILKITEKSISSENIFNYIWEIFYLNPSLEKK